MEIGATRPFFARRYYAPKTKATLKVALASIVLRIELLPTVDNLRNFCLHQRRVFAFQITAAELREAVLKSETII